MDKVIRKAQSNPGTKLIVLYDGERPRFKPPMDCSYTMEHIRLANSSTIYLYPLCSCDEIRGMGVEEIVYMNTSKPL